MNDINNPYIGWTDGDLRQMCETEWLQHLSALADNPRTHSNHQLRMTLNTSAGIIRELLRRVGL